ncbi:type-F conjugative transfer system secretin TraK [Sphaerotilus sp.]|uniref:type-F conjugative transfer system secretin TraK n=1 Tax=Sphaerotilus sp. TaxID=2093942 RepID=UPI002ACE0686|nr:type-F conjugative transfer system secretin TraK [Sphaerotilus sp.]MDZ7855934.1 type-F conjugative transfer system secretin TraK [Sphaerotilus sp.]
MLLRSSGKRSGGHATRRWLNRSAVLFLAAVPALPAFALQVIEARDGVAVEAIVSIKEATRIRIEGAPITDVFGSIYSSNCGVPPQALAGTSPGVSTPGGNAGPLVNPAGEIVLECDRDKGEIYVRPMGETLDGKGKPVNLFISSAQATYTLLLRRADTPADTIVIRDKTARTAAAVGSPATQGPQGTSANHVRAMKALLVAMASDRVTPDIRVDEINQPVQLWAEARLLLLRRYEGRSLVGEHYQLHNVSSTVMVLAEQEFDRPNSADGGQVLGVAIEHHNLRPGESTSVFVIRRGGTQ